MQFLRDLSASPSLCYLSGASDLPEALFSPSVVAPSFSSSSLCILHEYYLVRPAPICLPFSLSSSISYPSDPRFTALVSELEWRCAGCPRFPVWSPTFWDWVNDPSPVFTPVQHPEDLGLEARELADFRARLSPLDQLVFDKGHRLSRSDRSAALAKLPHGVREDRGYFFSDSPEHSHPVLWNIPVPPVDDQKSDFKVKLFLCDAWVLLPPLELEWLASAISHGAPVLYSGDRSVARFAPNKAALVDDPSLAIATFDAEIAAGRRSPYFKRPPFSNSVVVPLGTVPKTKFKWDAARRLWLESVAVRLIADFSCNYTGVRNARVGHDSINALLSNFPCPSASFSDVKRTIISAGPGASGLLQDVANAHSSVEIALNDAHLGVVFVPGKGYSYTRRHQFGAKDAACHFDKFAIFLVFLLRLLFNFLYICRCVDDILILSRGPPILLKMVQASVVYASKRYGILMSPPKFIGPDSVVKFLGYEWNLAEQSIAIPGDKVAKYSSRFREWLELPKWEVKNLEKFIGTLEWIGHALPALLFINRLWRRRWHELCHLPNPPSVFAPSQAFRSHLRLVLTVLELFNKANVLFLTSQERRGEDAHDFTLFTDASDSGGWGSFCPSLNSFSRNDWRQEEIASHLVVESYSSSLFEAKGITCAILSHGFSNCSILVKTDNESFFQRWNGQRFNGNEAMDDVTTALICVCVDRNLSLDIQWISRSLNSFADLLSKQDGLRLFQEHLASSSPPSNPSFVPPVSPSAPVRLVSPHVIW